MSLDDVLARLPAIGLPELNARAALLSRSDRKYLVPQRDLPVLLGELAATHDVLQVDGARRSSYRSVYFDDPTLRLHRDHLQGRRLRWKARTRLYVDSGLCFRELKVKGPRGSTIKLRESCRLSEHGQADRALHAFVDAGLREQYDSGLDLTLEPALAVAYVRTTLAAVEGGERLTIDRDLQVSHPDGRPVGAMRPDLSLLEVKTGDGPGGTDRLLARLGHRPIHLSKYGVGTVLAHDDVAAGDMGLLVRRNFVAEAQAAPRAA